MWKAAEIRREIQADEQRLERALLNIIANAAEYAGQGDHLPGGLCPGGWFRDRCGGQRPGIYGEALKKEKKNFIQAAVPEAGAYIPVWDCLLQTEL